MVSGTRIASDWRADTGTSARRRRGTATACFTCTIPTMSSTPSSTTGNREYPVSRVRSMTAWAHAVRWMLATRGRGVITSEAVCPENSSVRCSRVAVSFSSSPALAERRTREDSSSAVRAPESSSFGSIPIDRSTPLALPLRTTTAGLSTVVNSVWNGMTSFAVCTGRARAKFFGTSSPMIMEARVATAIAIATATTGTTAGESPRAVSGGDRSDVRAGSMV